MQSIHHLKGGWTQPESEQEKFSVKIYANCTCISWNMPKEPKNMMTHKVVWVEGILNSLTIKWAKKGDDFLKGSNLWF